MFSLELILSRKLLAKTKRNNAHKQEMALEILSIAHERERMEPNWRANWMQNQYQTGFPCVCLDGDDFFLVYNISPLLCFLRRHISKLRNFGSNTSLTLGHIWRNGWGSENRFFDSFLLADQWLWPKIAHKRIHRTTRTNERIKK